MSHRPSTPLVRLIVLAILLGLGPTGCAPHLSLFGTGETPLTEQVLEGKAEDKVLIVPIHGTINSKPKEGFLRDRPGVVQDVVSQLEKAREDKRVKAVLLRIDSPGGSSVDSDILLHEIDRYRARSGSKVASMLMGLATSGGYYAAIGGERIYANPGTITGSVGTIFIRPAVRGLMDKIGVEADVTKSGPHKDMLSPFRDPAPEERDMVKRMIDAHTARFLGLVAERRSLSGDRLATVATARVFSSGEALDIGLVDKVCYLDEALEDLKKLAALPGDAKVVVYRRSKVSDDNPYIYADIEPGSSRRLLDLGLSEFLAVPRTGFYHLWAPEYDAW